MAFGAEALARPWPGLGQALARPWPWRRRLWRWRPWRRRYWRRKPWRKNLRAGGLGARGLGAGGFGAGGLGVRSRGAGGLGAGGLGVRSRGAGGLGAGDQETLARLSDHVLLPLVSDSHLFVASPEEYMIWIFWEMTSGIIFRCGALGSTVDTCVASVYEILASFTYFLRESELGS